MTSDRALFERPWLIAAGWILLGLGLASLMLSAPGWMGGLLGPALACFALALGVRGPRTLLGISLGFGLLGFLVPNGLAFAIAGFGALSLGGFLAFLRIKLPTQPVRIEPGLEYTFAGNNHVVPPLTYEGRPVFLLRPEIAEELIALAEYAHRFLDRHAIGHAMMYGTLLGGLRHGGLIPWDDDVDFVIYRDEDLARLDADFARFRAAAEADGFNLFRHNDYWKLARKGVWNYPMVDLYRHPGLMPRDARPVMLDWEGLSLPAPADPAGEIGRRFGPDCLQHAIMDLPYWDSGFLPAAVLRLVGLRTLDGLHRLYELNFTVRAK